MSAWIFQQGETIAVPLVARGAAPADLAGIVVTAALKRSSGYTAPPASVAAIAEMIAEPRDDIAGEGAGWLLSVDVAAASALEVGRYAVNARLAFADGTVVKSAVLIIAIEPAT